MTSTTGHIRQFLHLRRHKNLKGCEDLIAGVEGSSLTNTEKANYIALARLHRARQYYQLVQRYGDVILATKTVDTNDTDILYA